MPPLGPEVIRRQVVIGASAISPDGQRVVYTRRTVAGDRYQVNLWLVPSSGGRPRRLTHGKWSDTAPAWSPDGRTIAFISDRATTAKPDDETAELYLIDPDGGEAERVCTAPHGAVGAPLWSPDGRTIAFVSPGDEVRFWTGDPKKHVARVIRTTDWQDDGGTRDRREHLFLVPARAGARPRQLTKGDFDVSQPSWHPSGKRIAFTSNLEADADLHPKTRIYEVAVRGGKPKELVALPGFAEQPVWSPDGRKLAFVGTDIPGAPDYAEPTLWVREGTSVRSLTAHLDIPTCVGWGSDLHDWLVAIDPTLRWDGDDVLSIVNRLGRDEVWRAPLRGEPEPVTTGDTTRVGALGRRRPHHRHGDRRPDPTRGVRRRGRHAAVAHEPRRSVASAKLRPGRARGRRRRRPGLPLRAARRRRANGDGARSARRPVRIARARPPSSTRGCSSRAGTASWLPTSAGRAATGAPGSRRSRATGAAPTPTIS